MAWPQNSVIYQIYPRSFKDSDGNGIGDIAGIIEKIEYLKELGVNAVWLSPIYSSPQKDFGYDVSDYRNIDPIFGNLNQFDELVSKLHGNGIKILMDFIPNHTSDQHKWFTEARKNKTNPKRDWYIWADGKNGGPPNNWISAFGGSAWTLDKNTSQYYYHAFEEHQPDLNWNNPDVRSEMFDTMRFWLNRGIDGFRIDATDHLVEDQALRDEPPNPSYAPGYNQYTDRALLHIYTRKLQPSIDLLKDMAKVIQEYEDKIMVTEAEAAASTLDELISMYRVVDWHAYHPFNFSLITLPWLAEPHKEYIDLYEESLDDHYLPCYVTGNHDNPRVLSRIGPHQARNAALLLLTLRGNAFIYNGEEIGMRNRRIPTKYATDTFDIHSPGLGLGRNGERTPMQWDQSNNAGFSSGKPWLPISLSYKRVNAREESKDPKSFLNLYKKLIKLKKTNPALSKGNYTPLSIVAENVFAFIRQKDDYKVLVLVNFSNQTKKISLDFKKGKIILNSFLDRKKGEIVDLRNFKLRPDEGIIIEIN